MKGLIRGASCCVALALMTTPLQAENWQSTNIQLQWSDGYQTGSDAFNNSYDEQTTVVIEHANSWAYGSNFFFAELHKLDTGASGHYFEFTPSLSLNKITGKDYGNSFIKDYRLTATLENASGSASNRLVGLGLDLNIPKFAFFNLDLLSRDNPGYEGRTHQFTMAWLLPFQVGKYNLRFGGFADIAGEEGEGSTVSKANTHIQPQLLVDMSQFWGKEDLYAGVEYVYWDNKFGSENYDESLTRYMIKWIF